MNECALNHPGEVFFLQRLKDYKRCNYIQCNNQDMCCIQEFCLYFHPNEINHINACKKKIA